MSEASQRGRSFELEVAGILRKQLGARIVRDPRSGAGSHHKSDLKDYYRDLPFDFELKDHEKLNFKASMRQAIDGASMGRTAVLALRMDEFIIAALKLDDLVSMQAEIQDLRKEVALLRQPVAMGIDVAQPGSDHAVFSKLDQVTKQKATVSKMCGGGHIADEYGYCMQITCKFSRGYRAPKEPKGKK